MRCANYHTPTFISQPAITCSKLTIETLEVGCEICSKLKLVSAIFYQIFIFSPNDSPSKTIKNVFLFHRKSSFRSRDIQIFVIFSLPFHTFQIQKDKWKCNNL